MTKPDAKLPVEWTDSDGVEHSISLDYAAKLAKHVFEAHGNDIEAVDAALANPDAKLSDLVARITPENRHDEQN